MPRHTQGHFFLSSRPRAMPAGLRRCLRACDVHSLRVSDLERLCVDALAVGVSSLECLFRSAALLKQAFLVLRRMSC